MKDIALLVSQELRSQSEAPPRSRTRAEEEFAAAMAATPALERWMSQGAPEQGAASSPAPVANGSTSTTAAAWRGSADAMTESGQATPPPNRLCVEVRHAELGNLSIAVEQGGDGVRVAIGVENSAALITMEVQRGLLIEALHAAGVPVASATVVVGKVGGTVVAPRTSVQRQPRPSGSRNEEGDGSDLDLVG